MRVNKNKYFLWSKEIHFCSVLNRDASIFLTLLWCCLLLQTAHFSRFCSADLEVLAALSVFSFLTSW